MALRSRYPRACTTGGPVSQKRRPATSQRITGVSPDSIAPQGASAARHGQTRLRERETRGVHRGGRRPRGRHAWLSRYSPGDFRRASSSRMAPICARTRAPYALGGLPGDQHVPDVVERGAVPVASTGHG